MPLISTDGTSCELSELRPYPSVTSTDNTVSVTPVLGPDGKVTFDLSSSSTNTLITATKQPLYEYRYIWAEESGGTTANSAEWSFGNGATGFIGLPLEDGWELIQMSIHADTFAAQAVLQVDAMAYPFNSPGAAAANTVASMTISGSTDGSGETNNAVKIVDFTPVPVPSCVLGFITRTRTGNSSDVRVTVKLRKQIGEYVSEVTGV